MKGIQLTDYDLSIKVERDNGGKILSGLVVNDILSQNQAIILMIRKGELKEDPTIGVGLSDMLLEHDLMAIRTEIRQQLELDQQTVDVVKVTSSDVIIEAHY